MSLYFILGPNQLEHGTEQVMGHGLHKIIIVHKICVQFLCATHEVAYRRSNISIRSPLPSTQEKENARYLKIKSGTSFFTTKKGQLVEFVSRPRQLKIWILFISN